MKVFELPFSLEIPTQVSNLKIIFFVSDRLYAFGENCASGPHNHGDYELRLLQVIMKLQFIQSV